MNRSTRLLTATLALVGGLAAAGAAQARDDVQWSVTIGSNEPLYAPVYTAPVYTAPAYPAPVYNAPVTPVYRAPQPVYREPVVVPQYHYRHPTRWDRDGDGIPNRYDRVYNPVWDRDGDGIPNRYDRHDDYRRWGRGH